MIGAESESVAEISVSSANDTNAATKMEPESNTEDFNTTTKLEMMDEVQQWLDTLAVGLHVGLER